MKKIMLYSVLLVVGLFGFTSNDESGYEVGDVVSDFKLKNVDGELVAMKDYKDAKGFIVVFTCNTCPFSVMYEDRIIELAKTYEAKGFPLIAINPNDVDRSPGDAFEKMVTLAKTNNYPFPYLYDETQEVAKQYGATNTPHVYVLSKENKAFKVAYIGAIDNNARDESAADSHYVAEAVNALLAGKAVPTTKTKAIGCTIKWKK